MRSSSISLAFALASCSTLLGLDATVKDTDGDGVPDAIDTCPEIPATDQADSDGDGVGDACSVCVTFSGVDLDGDNYDDACDRCIGPGPLGIDTDGDGLDDGCDPCVGGSGITGVSENLGGVGTTGIDANGDGIDDGCELCFDTTGPDTDGDLLNDVCDTCNVGPPHDEDGDGIADACDNCPVVPNPSQEASADETIGVACDPRDDEPHKRLLFDPFLIEDMAGWGSIDPGWVIGSDVALATNAVTRIGNGIIAALVTWTVTTRLELEPGARGGIQLSSNGDFLGCEADASGFVELVLAVLKGPVQIASSATFVVPTAFQLRATQTSPSDLGGARWRCEALTDDGVVVAQAELFVDAQRTWFPGLIAAAGMKFHWIEVISGP